MADKEDDIELIQTGEEDKPLDSSLNDSASYDKQPQQDEDSELSDEGEETADLVEENEEDGGNGELAEADSDEENDVVFTNVESSSVANTSSKTGFFQKIKRKLGFQPKVHSVDSDAGSSTTITVKYIPPPAPPNMPSARDSARARVYRREKVRYGKEKIAYYLEAMHNNTLVVDDLIMRSETNKEYVKGI